MELGFFERVGEVARQGAPDNFGQLNHRAHRGGVKVWYGAEKSAREHYEAQLVSRHHLDGTDGTVLEIGFHAEHRDADANQSTIDVLVEAADSWTETLGPVLNSPDTVSHDVVVADRFLGNNTWRRLSETWEDFDVDDAELSFEAGARLAEYIVAIQPVLNSSASE